MSVRYGPSVVAHDHGGEIVLLRLDEGTYFGLHGSAAAAVRALTGGAALGDALAALRAAFAVDAATLARDVDALLAALAARGLVEALPPGGCAAAPRPPGAAPAEAGTQPYAPPELVAYGHLRDVTEGGSVRPGTFAAG